MNRINTCLKTKHAKLPRTAQFAVNTLSACLLLAFSAAVQALPTGGVVAAGAAGITNSASGTTITQTSNNAVINWQSFGVGAGQTVQFIQPGSSSIALNRVLGSDPSSILGNLTANGKVFLLNPNGVLFGNGASVSVGGLVASTLSITDANFMAGRYAFTDAGNGTVVNQGNINAADGGYVTLMGKSVSNQGVISARMGTVALAAGNAITMDIGGDGLLNLSISQGVVNALIENGGMIRADGGRVLLTAQAAGNLLNTVVNNTGVIQAQTIDNRNGEIFLLGDMQSGKMNVGGTLDASAPNGGNGGFIETSAAHVKVMDSARVTTAAPAGLIGTFLIDPQDFIIAAGENISGATLSALLVNNSVTITTSTGPDTIVAGTPPLETRNTATPGNGDIFVKEAIEWTTPVGKVNTTLTLNAERDVNINASITATKGNLVVCCGRDINVNAAITATNGSILLAAGRNVNQNAAIALTNGNLMMCAANDVVINAKIKMTNGQDDPTRSLGLPLGLSLIADTDGTGPGIAGGTVIMNVSGAGRPEIVGTAGVAAPVTINYNPVSYAAPTDYLPKFILVDSALTQRMLVFPEVTKNFDGGITAAPTSLKGNPANVSLIAGPGATATFDNTIAGTNKIVTFSGYSLGGTAANRFALPSNCCAPIVQKTTGTVRPAVVPGVSATSPYIALVPLTFASYRSGLVPTYASDAGDVFFAIKEDEAVLPTVTPSVTPPPPFISPPPPYVAPRYVPKPARN